VARGKPRARPDLVVAELDGEAVVYDPLPDKLHYLNHTAALIFQLCNGRMTISEIAGTLGDAYEMDAQVLEDEIRPLLRRLQTLGLVEGKAADRIAKEASTRQRRRGALRRIEVPGST
jgi:PqqD family protein of HPr-rel-A system